MIKVAGLWELGWNTPIKEMDLWEYPLRDFGVDCLHMAPVSGIADPFVREHADLSTALDQFRRDGLQVVFLDERGKTTLREFEHPENVAYVCGKASLSAMSAYGKPGDVSVRIETVANGGMLWPHQAAALVLYDRLVKSWR